MPDVVLCLNGLFAGLELKSPGEEPTKLQALTLREIHEAGGMTGWTSTYVGFLQFWAQYVAAARVDGGDGESWH